MSDIPYTSKRLIAVRPRLRLHAGREPEGTRPALLLHIPAPRQPDEEEWPARFSALAAPLVELEHPTLPRTRFQTLAADGDGWLAQEHPRGNTLAELLSRCGPLAWRQAVALVRPVVAGLEAAHARGVLHLALRPEVLLLAPEGDPTLAELAVVQLTLPGPPHGLTLTDAAWQSSFPVPQMVAPELLAEGRWDERTDVHGVGMLLFHALTSSWPFTSTQTLRVYNQIRAGVPRAHVVGALGDAPGALRDLVADAIARDPGDRPQTMAALAARLDGALLNTPGAELEAAEAAGTDPLGPLRLHSAALLYGHAFPPPSTDQLAPRNEGAADRRNPTPAEGDQAREQALKLLEVQLGAMRSPQRRSSSRRVQMWVVALALLALFAWFFPKLVSQRTPMRRYEGGVHPATGLSHSSPGPVPIHRTPRRPADDLTIPRGRLPIE